MPAQDSHKDTIAAIATPPGEGGVGIIRISGSRGLEILGALFTSSKTNFTGFKPYRLHHGIIHDASGRELDEVLAVHMPGPGSYTGEDVVEINCHGGQAVLRAVLGEILAHGARRANPGEFTLRGFLNGRMDLTQAEAVAEMISAPTKAALQLAQIKLSGLLGRKIAALRSQLEELRAKLCVAVDFPEEELDCLPPEELTESVEAAALEIRELLAGVDRARAWREGALVVLMGRVNAGKSSLLNALLGKNRAIVTDVPGTTRDYLEEIVNLDGLHVRVVDTAGLRETQDRVERAGLTMSRELSERADLVLFILDGTEEPAAETIEAALDQGKDRTLVVLNKLDISPASSSIVKKFKEKGMETISLSAKTGKNLQALCTRIRERVLAGCGEPDPGELAPNARQAEALDRAMMELEALKSDALSGIPYDLLGVRLELACAALSEITGEITPTQVLDSIFERFCIGK